MRVDQTKRRVAAVAVSLLFLAGCSSASDQPPAAPAEPTTKDEIDLYRGDPASSSVYMSREEAAALLAQMATVHPELSKPRELSDARSVCSDILTEEFDSSALADRAATRFGNGSDRIISNDQALRLIEIIRANGFCREK